jgi:putative membrane protein
MRNFLFRLIINAVALAAAAALLPGIHTSNNDIGTLLIVAFIFGVMNAILKPILYILSCSLIILTLGLFTLVINGVMLLITDAIAGNRFTVDGFWWAVLGGLVVSIVSGFLENALGLHEHDEHPDEKVTVISQ